MENYTINDSKESNQLSERKNSWKGSNMHRCKFYYKVGGGVLGIYTKRHTLCNDFNIY